MQRDNAPLAAAPVIPVPATPLFAEGHPLWAQLLITEIGSDRKRGKAGVATRLGFKRAYVSRVIATLEGRSSGFPNGVPQPFIARVMDRLHVIRECPATHQPQPRGECQRIGNGAAPTHNPLALRIWKVCQGCQHKPEKE